MSHERKQRRKAILRAAFFGSPFFALGLLALLFGAVGDLHTDPLADIALLVCAPILLFLGILVSVVCVYLDHRQ